MFKQWYILPELTNSVDFFYCLTKIITLPFMDFSICSFSWARTAFLFQRKFLYLGCWHFGQPLTPDECLLEFLRTNVRDDIFDFRLTRNVLWLRVLTTGILELPVFYRSETCCAQTMFLIFFCKVQTMLYHT